MEQPDEVIDEMESQSLAQSISKLQKENSEEEAKRRKVKRITQAAVGGTGFLLLLFGSLYIYFKMDGLESQVVEQRSMIQNLEQNLFSLRLEEQSKQEELIRLKSQVYEELPEMDLSEAVEKNKEVLQNNLDPEMQARNISRGNREFPEIALTFDLGSGEDLRTIYEYMETFPNVKVTLFVSNENPAREYGSLFSRTNIRYLRKFAAMPDRVAFGNHTWSHYNLPRSVAETSLRKRLLLNYVSDEILDLDSILKEMEMAEAKFKELTGRDLLKIYRLPYGAINDLVLDTYAKYGYKDHIFWSSNSFGSLDVPDFISKKYVYKENDSTGKTEVIRNPDYKTQKEMLEFLLEWETKDDAGMNGAIILMHLGSPRHSDKLIEILPDFITEMEKKGYHFVTVPQVMNSKLD